jgi:predicted metal-dependent hydrolase
MLFGVKDKAKKQPLRTKEGKVLTLGLRQIPYTLVSSRLARTVHIKISLKNGLEVVTPFRFNPNHVDRFLKDKQEWIIRHMGRMSQLKKSQPDFADGATIRIFGQPVKIRIFKQPNGRGYVTETADEMKIFCGGSILSAKKNLTVHLKKIAREYLTRKTHELSKIMGVNYNRIAIRSQASRWGSCSRENNLNFNWKLIFFDPEVVNYVIMHELAHTVQHNHSEKFYSFLAQFCPNYKILRKKLRNVATPL